MSYLQETAEACERLLRKHEPATDRLNRIRVTPATLRAVVAQGLTVSRPGDGAVAAIAPLPCGASIGLPAVKLRRRYSTHNPALDVAAAEYEALPVSARYGWQSKLARKHGVKQPQLHAHLIQRRIARAMAENAAQPKAA